MVGGVWRQLALARRQLIFGCLALLAGRAASAQPAAPSPAPEAFGVVVERDQAAAACPDLPWFEARIAAHPSQSGHAGEFELAFTRRGGAWHATIRRWQRNDAAPAAERTLQDRSPSCEPLAEAVALTVAILADDHARRAATAPPPVAPASEEKPRPPEQATTPPAPEERSPARVWVGAGGGAALSFISPLAPELGFGVALDTLRFRHGLRLMMTTEQKFELVPGRIVIQAWLASMFSCSRFGQGSFGVALCGRVDASMLRASAEGFGNGQPSSRPYGAVGLELQPGWRVWERYRISAALAGTAPFTRESFSVTNRGVAYAPPRLNWHLLVLSEIGAF